MKKTWLWKLWIISLFTFIGFGFPVFSEASNEYLDFSSTDNIFLYIAISVAVFFCIMLISKYWPNKKIKPVNLSNSPTNRYPIIIQYEPPKWINSADAWLLYNCKVDPVDVTSLIYQWNANELIAISSANSSKNSKKITTAVIRKLKDISEDHPYYEREFFNELFKNSDVVVINHSSKLKFSTPLYAIEDYALAKKWVHRGNKFRYFGCLVLLAFIAALVALIHYLWWLWAIIWLFVTPILYGLFSKTDSKIRLKPEWEKLAAHVIWYARFIQACDEKQIKFFLSKDPLFVNKTLPYAIVFGMETEFLKKATPLIKDLESIFLTWELIHFPRINSLIFNSASFETNYEWYLFNPLSILAGMWWFLWWSGWGSASYSSSGWFSKWSSFGGWFSGGGGGWWGGWKSW